MRLKYGKEVVRFSTPAVNMLQAYSWPGNVRELENCIERAVLTAKGDCVHGYNLPPALQNGEFSESPFEIPNPGAQTMAEKVALYERHLIEDALRRHNGRQSEAGRELGISPRMMCYKIKRMGIAK